MTSPHVPREGTGHQGSWPPPPGPLCDCTTSPTGAAPLIRVRGITGGIGTTTTATVLALAALEYLDTVELAAHDPHTTAAFLGLPDPDHAGAAIPGLRITPTPTRTAALTIYDAGPVEVETPSADHPPGHELVVMRGPCYLALRRWQHLDVQADAAILIHEQHCALTPRDAYDVTGTRIIITTASPGIARTID